MFRNDTPRAYSFDHLHIYSLWCIQAQPAIYYIRITYMEATSLRQVLASFQRVSEVTLTCFEVLQMIYVTSGCHPSRCAAFRNTSNTVLTWSFPWTGCKRFDKASMSSRTKRRAMQRSTSHRWRSGNHCLFSTTWRKIANKVHLTRAITSWRKKYELKKKNTWTCNEEPIKSKQADRN